MRTTKKKEKNVIDITRRKIALAYLATPYSHPDPETKVSRYEKAVELAGYFLKKGLYIYSPIAHSHPIAHLCNLPTGWTFWQRYDECMVRRSDVLLECRLDGWESSLGMGEEVRLAHLTHIPVVSVPKDGIEAWWEIEGRHRLAPYISLPELDPVNRDVQNIRWTGLGAKRFPLRKDEK